MTRLARDRDTHLTREEIAAEALRQFDEGSEPSIRSLAAALKVGPTAIYHHFPSRAAIVRTAADVVWNEIPAETFALIGNPFEADPVEALVAGGIATRRAFARHHRIAPHLVEVPQPNAMRAASLGVIGNAMERLGLHREQASEAMHLYGTFVVGSALFMATRLTSNAELGDTPDNPLTKRFHTEHPPAVVALSSAETLSALDDVMDMSIWDPERDDALFEQGLRTIIAAFTP